MGGLLDESGGGWVYHHYHFCGRALLEQELANGRRYDLILVTRLDYYWIAPLNAGLASRLLKDDVDAPKTTAACWVPDKIRDRGGLADH